MVGYSGAKVMASYYWSSKKINGLWAQKEQNKTSLCQELPKDSKDNKKSWWNIFKAFIKYTEVGK